MSNIQNFLTLEFFILTYTKECRLLKIRGPFSCTKKTKLRHTRVKKESKSGIDENMTVENQSIHDRDIPRH